MMFHCGVTKSSTSASVCLEDTKSKRCDCVHVCACMCVSVCACTHVCMCVCIHLSMHVCVHMHVCAQLSE